MLKHFLLSILISLSLSFTQAGTVNTKHADTTQQHTLVATFGTGCFWCTEAIFEELDGVLKVTAGYSGGHVPNPTYKEVCTGTTGHAECLNIEYDPAKISFDELLEVFWQTHDPTSLNKQGNDTGTQYRSVVFYHNKQQKNTVEKYITQLNKSGAWKKPVVTSLEPFAKFYPAEAYHQDYYVRNSQQSYCHFVIRPELDKFEKVFSSKLKKNAKK